MIRCLEGLKRLNVEIKCWSSPSKVVDLQSQRTFMRLIADTTTETVDGDGR